MESRGNRYRNPTQWGSTGQLVGSAVTGATRIKSKLRLIDVRLPTITEGWYSRDCTVYTFAKALTGTVIPGSNLTTSIQCTLSTGMGGLTQTEAFRMPAVGRSIHIVADSVRLDAEIPADIDFSFEVSANVGTGGLYQHTTQKKVDLAVATGGLIQIIDIPNFCVAFQVQCPNPQLLDIAAVYNSFPIQTIGNGLIAVDYIPIPIIANELKLDSSVDQTVLVTFLRPS
ncbi:MAG: hypothetical protein ACYSWP_17810 [Planctomycetota bacterium]|jgi:hypothetical protein